MNFTMTEKAMMALDIVEHGFSKMDTQIHLGLMSQALNKADIDRDELMKLLAASFVCLQEVQMVNGIKDENLHQILTKAIDECEGDESWTSKIC